MTIETVGVVGAGVMGAGIAAHCANAGLKVHLLDIVPDGADDRDAIAKAAIARMRKADPPPFMSQRAARRVTPGNTEDHLDRLGECDWIVEAVVERADVKRQLYARVDGVRKPDAIVSSNTSTLPLSTLCEGMSDSLRRDFMITHFFNPPRFMRLLEVVSGPDTRAEAVERLCELADTRLGKGVVHAKDTPGFVANRIGTFWLQCAVSEAFERGLSIEEADAVLGRPFGIPKTGVFALMDLVGIDLMPYVDRSLADRLPPSDGYHAVRRDHPLIERMIAEGYTGRKGKGGFYRRVKTNGATIKEAMDLASGAYRRERKPALESLDMARRGGAAALVAHDDRGGAYARAVMGKTLAYAAALVPEIAEDIVAVDRAMRLGYNWKQGPFEMIDALGADRLTGMLAAEGAAVPPLLAKAAEAGGFYRVIDGKLTHLSLEGDYRPVTRPEGVLLLDDVKRQGPPVARNGSASLWDIGDGVVCLEVHTKLNTIDADVLAMMQTALETVPADYKALVIYNEGTNFSAGANLGLALFAANLGMWEQVAEIVEKGQKVYRALRRAPFPVVAAPSGMALGGGCEILLSADHVEAHAESYIGLVEVGVGLVPAWGGCAEMLSRLASDPKRPKGPMPPVADAFETIGLAKVAKSAFEAREMGFLRASDGIVYNRDRLLASAKRKALALSEDYAPPPPIELSLPGPTGKAALRLALRDLANKGAASAYDQQIADALATVLSGGGADITEPLGEDEILRLEREHFMQLVRNEKTLERMEHTLETGKPLRN